MVFLCPISLCVQSWALSGLRTLPLMFGLSHFVGFVYKYSPRNPFFKQERASKSNGNDDDNNPASASPLLSPARWKLL